MQLLVSVRDASEAERALAGGASIIDAKEPSRGALGPVARDRLLAIRQAIPAEVPVSAAMGDARSAGQVRRAVERARGIRLAFLKLGFAGIADYDDVCGLLVTAVTSARALDRAPGIVAVGYADWRRAESIEPTALPEIAARAGANGILVDTAFKDRGGLFDLCSPGDVAEIAARAHACGLFLALAGRLRAEHFTQARAAGCDIVGVRGAVCEGGRCGAISSDLVGSLVAAARRPQALVIPSASTAGSRWSSSSPTTEIRRSSGVARSR